MMKTKQRVKRVVEDWIGVVFGIVASVCVFRFNPVLILILDEKILDRMLTVSIALFGFLLAIMTLILQISNNKILEMKKYGSFDRLVNRNKRVVFLCFALMILTIVVSIHWSYETKEGTAFKLLASCNFGLFIIALVETFQFTRFFYLLSKSQ